jgi:hypothetical protein
MYITPNVVTVTTAADGSGVGYTPVVNGRVLAISYVKPAEGGYADTVDFDIQTEDSAVTIWDEDNVTASKAVYPRAATHTTAGVGAVFASAGEAVLDYIPVANERIKITVENGGDGGTGTFYVMVG